MPAASKKETEKSPLRHPTFILISLVVVLLCGVTFYSPLGAEGILSELEQNEIEAAPCSHKKGAPCPQSVPASRNNRARMSPATELDALHNSLRNLAVPSVEKTLADSPHVPN